MKLTPSDFFRNYQHYWYIAGFGISFILYFLSYIEYKPNKYIGDKGEFVNLLGYGVSGPGCSDIHNNGYRYLFYISCIALAITIGLSAVHNINLIRHSPVSNAILLSQVVTEQPRETSITPDNEITSLSASGINDKGNMPYTKYITPYIRKLLITDTVFILLAALLTFLCGCIPTTIEVSPASLTSTYFGCIISVLLVCHIIIYSSICHLKGVLDSNIKPNNKEAKVRELKGISMFRILLCALAAVISLNVIGIVSRIEMGEHNDYCKNHLICIEVPGASTVFIGYINSLVILGMIILTHSLISPLSI